ncbi:hypothetical protein C2E23DRAFT_801477 [Lenzites betulinus]|nr:hypothetical protein C2E23DRAFT_801477 [Lenzites betulinus]
MGKKAAYAVTVGRKIGVFTRWIDVAPNIKVTGATWEGFDDWESAQEAFDDSKRRGDTKIVEPPPKAGKRVYESSSKGDSCRSTKTDKTVRDALIGEALEELKWERQRNGSKGRERDEGQRSATRCTSQARPPATAPCSPSRESEVECKPRLGRGTPSRGGRDTASRPSEASTSSSPPTGVTQHEHGSDSVQSPRYAQSLSYGSDLSPTVLRDRQFASPATGSSALASSDRKTDVSEPSTRVTKYFPADFKTRPRDAYTKAHKRDPRSPVRSPASTVSEYATPPSSARTLPPGLSSSTSVKETSSARPSGRSTAASPVTSPPVKHRKFIGKSFSEANIQDECETKRRQIQAHITNPKQYATIETQTTPSPPVRRAPLRATVSEGDVLRENHTRKEACECERPEHVCRCCGLPTTARALRPVATSPPTSTAVAPAPAASPVARSVASPAARPMASPASTQSVVSPVARPTTRSPASVASPQMSIWSPLASTERADSPAPSTRSGSPASFHSAEEGHTPLLGLSDRQTSFSATMRDFEEGLDTLVGSISTSTRARDVVSPQSASALLHDVTFDPRSPLQRGTIISAGSEHSLLMRPSPTMAPMNSLLFSQF